MAQTLCSLRCCVAQSGVVRRSIADLVSASEEFYACSFAHRPASTASFLVFCSDTVYAFLLCTTPSFRHRAVSLCTSCFGLLCACYTVDPYHRGLLIAPPRSTVSFALFYACLLLTWYPLSPSDFRRRP